MTEQAPKGGKADSQLVILSRVKYIGPEPPSSEDEVMDMVVEEVRAVRAAWQRPSCGAVTMPELEGVIPTSHSLQVRL